MIKTEIISDNVLKITAPPKLKADDFRQIAPQVDSMISRYRKIRLLIDASGFNGWEDIAAFGNHAGFVKSHQQKVDRIAVIVAHNWQHWLIGIVRGFVHPEVRAYDKDHENEALHWKSTEPPPVLSVSGSRWEREPRRPKAPRAILRTCVPMDNSYLPIGKRVSACHNQITKPSVRNDW